MTFAVIRKRNQERQQMAQARASGMFLKMINDQDTIVYKLVPPFEGYDKPVIAMNGETKNKPHYRGHIIGAFNARTKKPLGEPIAMTADEVRALKDIDAKIWTTPFNAAASIAREVELGHSILQIRRDGIAKSTSTSYNVMYAMSIYDTDWQYLLPKITKEELAKLQSEEQWNEINPVDLEVLQKMGVREEQ